MSAYLVVVTTHAGLRRRFMTFARTGLDAQLQVLSRMEESPRGCSAKPMRRAA
jgi:hypothetical protein